VEATKSLYVPIPARKARRALLRPATVNGAQSRAETSKSGSSQSTDASV